MFEQMYSLQKLEMHLLGLKALFSTQTLFIAACRQSHWFICRVKSAKLTLFGKLCIKYTVSATMFFEGLWAVEIKKGQEAIFFLQVFR